MFYNTDFQGRIAENNEKQRNFGLFGQHAMMDKKKAADKRCFGSKHKISLLPKIKMMKDPKSNRVKFVETEKECIEFSKKNPEINYIMTEVKRNERS